jgi:hypothetical protein
MGDKYAFYARDVIQDRAIPDARDGLKPVQRRILFDMYNTGNTIDKPTKNAPTSSATSWANTTRTAIQFDLPRFGPYVPKLGLSLPSDRFPGQQRLDRWRWPSRLSLHRSPLSALSNEMLATSTKTPSR